MTDQEIYSGIQRRDNAAFSYLYKEYKSMIIAMVQKNNGNESDALDIFQEGLVAMWSNISQDKYQLSDKARLSTYLYTLCRNIWISRLRKLQHTREFELNDDFDQPEDADELQSHYEMVTLLEKQLLKLNEACRNLLKHFYYEKLSLKEIALNMGITEKTAKNNKYRCMQGLRNLYENRDHDEN